MNLAPIPTMGKEPDGAIILGIVQFNVRTVIVGRNCPNIILIPISRQSHNPMSIQNTILEIRIDRPLYYQKQLAQMVLAVGPSRVTIPLPRTGHQECAGQVSKDARPSNYPIGHRRPSWMVVQPAKQGGPQGSGGRIQPPTPGVTLAQLQMELISSYKKSQLAGIDGLTLMSQNITTPEDPIRNLSGKPWESIRNSTHSKINSSSWLVIREGHWEKEKGGNTGARRGGKIGREGQNQTKALAIRQKTSEADKKEAGARQKRKSQQNKKISATRRKPTKKSANGAQQKGFKHPAPTA